MLLAEDGTPIGITRQAQDWPMWAEGDRVLASVPTPFGELPVTLGPTAP